jgi:pimeloyl-ACP methyl ester carboxylesterase
VTGPDPIPHWPGQSVSLGDHAVYVRSVPAAQGEPALCIHGLAGSSRNWTDLMDLLRPRLNVAALDLPGFGDSPPRPDGRYSIAAYTQTVAALIERGDRGPVHLIASSLGGAVAVKLAATRPDLVKTLTLISPAMPYRRPGPGGVRYALLTLPVVGPRLLGKYNALPPRARVADVITTCFSDPALLHAARFAAEVAELAQRDTLAYATAALTGTIRALAAETIRNTAWREASRVTVPTLVIYGGHDRVVDPGQAGRAAHAFKDARIVVLPRTGHLAHMERPAQVAAEMAAAGIPDGAARLTVARAGMQAPAPVR